MELLSNGGSVSATDFVKSSIPHLHSLTCTVFTTWAFQTWEEYINFLLLLFQKTKHLT